MNSLFTRKLKFKDFEVRKEKENSFHILTNGFNVQKNNKNLLNYGISASKKGNHI